jgi:CubicO group peptidase (beta-lactamase class C family)
LVIHALEDTEPFWTPGTRQGYHGFTIGYLVGELVRRITGRSIGTFFADEVAGPLGLDFWIGLPSEYESRVATTVPFDLTTATTLPPDFLAQMANPDSIAAKFFVNGGGWLTNIDRRDMHAAELPAAGGITNGRGLAGMYAVLATGGVPLVSAGAVSRMRVAQSVSDWDAVIGARTSYTMGFSKSWPNRDLGVGKSVIIGEDAFGTPGLGGQMGFADPAYRLAFGYTMNRHGIGTGLNERGQSLIDATYRILGSPTSEPGYWVRVR